ncbi:MAG: nitrilotriacetate monooxygenase [Porticoccaceae bacterium]|nr:nitrilotriacetate monooxygenase [Porticoccaceae bacterium]|tara:strand:- start:4159 stop:4662 length:504 start_codon:yes stop_codon:yes gene_type:complete
MPSEKKQVNTPPNSQSVALRNALGSFATGVTVVTAVGENGQNIGMTVNSFNSVSLNPALVLWSIDKKSNCFSDFIKAKSYAIHVLSHEQQAISDQFALSGEDKFSNLQCTIGLNNVPILPDFSACFECSVEHHYEGGDHIILVGKVIKFEDRGSQPLVFCRGSYTSF